MMDWIDLLLLEKFENHNPCKIYLHHSHHSHYFDYCMNPILFHFLPVFLQCYYYKSFTTQPFSGKEGSEFGRNGTHRRRCEQIRFAVSVFVDSDPLRTLHAP